MNNAEHESPCLAELAAAAPLNRQRGLGTSGEPGRGAGCFAGLPKPPHPKYQPFLTPACVPTKPRGHLREMQLPAPQSILLTAAKPQSELLRAHWRKVRLGSGPRGNPGTGGLCAAPSPCPAPSRLAGWALHPSGSPLRWVLGRGLRPEPSPRSPRGWAQGCAQTCGKWIVAGSCRVITLNKSLSMRSAANCHPGQPAAEWGQAGGGRGTGCAPTADSLKMSRGNGDGSVPEQPRQDCAARAAGGEPRGCFCPQHPLLTRGLAVCSPQEPAGTPVPAPPKRFFPPQTASQKAGGEPDSHPILSLEAEADLGPPSCPLPQFPHAWGRHLVALGRVTRCIRGVGGCSPALPRAPSAPARQGQAQDHVEPTASRSCSRAGPGSEAGERSVFLTAR